MSQVIMSDLQLSLINKQRETAAPVDVLLWQCNTLEAQLRETRSLGAHHLDYALHHLVAA